MHSATFTYDALGRRISKTINGITTEYLYDGNDIVAEIQNGAMTATYLRSLNIDEPFVRFTATGAEYYHTDALGSVIALTDQLGTTTTTYRYDPFGSTTMTGTSTNPFRYTGREDDGTGLYYYRARYYSPRLHRFVSEDPIGFSGGHINLYAYVRNNPITYIDPFGLKIDLTGAGDKLKGALDKVKKTKRGKELYDILDQSKTTYKIRDRGPGDPGPAFQRGHEIVVDPTFYPIIQTTEGPQRASTERILGHEMGHAATGASDFTGPGPGTNSITNENPIATELGEAPRTKY